MDEPWFTYWRRPGGKRQIVPRNAKGWATLIGFLLLVTGTTTLLPFSLRHSVWLLAPYLIFIAGLTFAFIRFALARSERIDSDLTPSELAEFRAWKRRGKR